MTLLPWTPKWESQNWVFYYFETLAAYIFFKSNLFRTCGQDLSFDHNPCISNLNE
jgi:hypothetical protein